MMQNSKPVVSNTNPLQFKLQNILLFILALPFLFVKFNVAYAPSAETQNSNPPITILLAVGDIMLSRNVSAKIEKASDPLLPFKNFQIMLSAADLTFGNLECPLDPGDIRIREGLGFRCLTTDAAGLLASGFDVLSTANNHAFDQGLRDLEFTLDYLRSQNILPIGTRKSTDPTSTAALVVRGGIKFGFLGYSYSAHNDGGKTTDPHIATLDIEDLKAAAANLRKVADVVVVSMHAGTEYTKTPNQEQIDFAHAAIDAGADVVIGHHPHWIQTIEIYHNKPIFYSLGNFVFDQMWSQETREGLAVELTFEEMKLQTAKLIPIIIEDYCCPRLATDIEKQKILKKINQTEDVIDFSYPN